MDASVVLQQYWDGMLPVNPARIARQMGIQLIEDPLMGYDAHYRFNKGNPVIEFDSNVPSTRLRFTLAHEVAHHVYQDVDAPRDTRDTMNWNASEYREVRANAFAAALIMPSDQVSLAVNQRGITNIPDLANLFGVSELAMHYRLRNLGYL